ncbi:MAG: phytanoyl-CoA dioxygenase family protein [Gammaproteobacteria bacterium]|nr:phytanoyl-CoA dioxygenase family protein [Gammaproteobacteria bacterium]
MAKVLSERALAQYRDEGYFFPIDVLSEAEVASAREQLETFEASQSAPLNGGQRSKSHLLFKWVDELMRHPNILDAVEDLIGPNLLCWNTLFWIKEARSPSFVSWHQDVRYWGLDTSELVTAWVALSPANASSGCMRVLPRSHLEEVMPHEDEYHDANMLTRGQSIAIEVDEDETVTMALQPGQMSLHNVQLAHASGPNQSDDRRIGLSLHYIPTRTRQTVSGWDSAALVRGTDEHGNFVLAPRPQHDFDPVGVAFHEKATGALRDILFKDAEKVRPTL